VRGEVIERFVRENASSYIVVAMRRGLLCIGVPEVADWLTQIASVVPLWDKCVEVESPAETARRIAEIYVGEIARATGKRWRMESMGSDALGFDFDAVPEGGGKRVALSFREEVSDENGHEVLTVFKALDAVLSDARTPYYVA